MMSEMRQFIKNLGIDLCGVVRLGSLQGMPTGLPAHAMGFLKNYQWAIVLGAQLGKPSSRASGHEASVFLEEAALDVVSFLEERGHRGLTIHTEDEFNPAKRMGLLSLKALAKGAGLGWQGRSLLIVSPEYGPIHRLVAVLTDMPLEPDQPITNRCEGCSLCVEKCPEGALTLRQFEDYPESREDVLDMDACRGDYGCQVCMVVCPWAQDSRAQA